MAGAFNIQQSAFYASDFFVGNPTSKNRVGNEYVSDLLQIKNSVMMAAMPEIAITPIVTQPIHETRG